MHILFYSCGSLEGIDLVGVLPGQVDIGSADMTESGYLTINRAAEVELLDYRSRAEIKDLVRGGGYLGVGDDTGAEAVNKNGDGLVNADSVGDFNFALVCKSCGDNVLRHVSCGICCGAVDLCRVLAGECAAAVA